MALITGGVSLAVGALTFVGTIVTVNKPSEKTCAAVIQEYSDVVNKNPNTIDVLDVAADSAASVGVISRSGFRRKKIDAAFAASTVPCRRWDLAIEDPTILERLRTVVAGMPLSTTVRQARAQVLEGIDPSDVETIEQVEDAFEQLSLRGESMSVRAALDQFRARTDDAAIGPGVHLLSAHTGKGQQFDWVFVIGLEEGHVPDHRCTGDDELAEEERVLLVMLSRARHGIVTTRARMKEGRFGPWEVGASPWWSDLAGTATMNWNALKAHLEQCYPSQDKAGDVSTLAASH